MECTRSLLEPLALGRRASFWCHPYRRVVPEVMQHHFSVVGQSLVFSSLPCFCTFYRTIPTCGSFLQEIVYSYSLCFSFTQQQAHRELQQYFLVILMSAYTINWKDATTCTVASQLCSYQKVRQFFLSRDYFHSKQAGLDSGCANFNLSLKSFFSNHFFVRNDIFLLASQKYIYRYNEQVYHA